MGAGCSQARVTPLLAVAIWFFVRGPRSGDDESERSAVFLRRVLVEEWSVGRARAEAGLGKSRAHELVGEFRAQMERMCEREGIDPVMLVEKGEGIEGLRDPGIGT